MMSLEELSKQEYDLYINCSGNNCAGDFLYGDINLLSYHLKELTVYLEAPLKAKFTVKTTNGEMFEFLKTLSFKIIVGDNFEVALDKEKVGKIRYLQKDMVGVQSMAIHFEMASLPMIFTKIALI